MEASMNEKIAIVVIMVLIVLVVGNWFDSYRVGYRQGQIDYHNGKIMYCLSVDDLAQTIWEKCNDTP